MDWQSLFRTIILCLVSILIEAVSAMKKGKEWFEQLEKPKFSFSLTIWYFVGAVYYLIFGVVSYRIFSNAKAFVSLQLIILAFVMIINGLSNFVIFKFRSTKWFSSFMYPFGVLLLSLIIIILPNDKISA